MAGTKVSTIADLKTSLILPDDDRVYYVASDTPSAGQFESQAIEGRVLKQIVGGVTKTVLTPTELLDIFLTPQTLVTDSFENPSIIVPQQFVLKFDWNSITYADEFTLQIKENPDNPDPIVELTDVLKFSSDKLYSVVPPNAVRECYKDSLDLVVRAKTQNPTAGNSTLTIWTFYKIVEL